MSSLFAPLLVACVTAQIAPPPRGQWCRDTTGTVPTATLTKLDRIAAGVDAAGAGQLGVLVVDTTSGQNPRQYATGVFNSWGVGHAGRNDGVLLFIATRDRKAEIILGDGCGLASSQTDVVMRDQVVANMKQGRLDQALTSAAEALSRLLRTRPHAQHTPAPEDNVGVGPDRYAVPLSSGPTSVDEVLMTYVRGERAFPERSPRTWVVDLSNGALTARQRANLDVVASDIYADGKGRLFFLVTQTAADWPDLPHLADVFLGRVRHLAATPVAVVAADLARRQLFLAVSPERLHGSAEWARFAAMQPELAQVMAQNDAMTALAHAGRLGIEILRTGVPARSAAQLGAVDDAAHAHEVVRRSYSRYKVPLWLSFGGLGVGGLWGFRRWLRRRPRTCEHCGRARQLLGEAADDEHLTEGQRSEERLGSVDYDVWWCGRCRDALVIDYSTWLSSYSRCPQCRSKTKSSRTTTLEHATTYSTGLERIDESCAHCSYKGSYTRTTARLPDTSSSDSSSSSSSSSSSFDGGSSSGGGSSGSW